MSRIFVLLYPACLDYEWAKASIYVEPLNGANNEMCGE